MKAVAVFPGTKEVRVIEQEAPRLTEPDQVRVRMLEIGICGTDKEICAFEYGTPPAGSDYLVIGHESLGEVMEVGPAVSRVKVGDLVVPTVRRPCSHAECRPCRAGYPDFCITGDYTERGIKGAHGFMTEEVVDHERYLHLVPPALRDVAVLTEPLTIAEKARDQIRQFVYRLPWVEDATPEEVRRNELTAVVLGAGPVGLLRCDDPGEWQALKRLSTRCRQLPIRVQRSSRRLEGSTTRMGSIPAETKQALFGHIHLIYEATGVSRLAFEVLKLLGPNSIFAMTGVPGLKEPIEVDADLLMRNIVLKNQVVFGTVNASAENFDAAIRDIGIFHQRWPGALRALITSRSTPEEAPGLLLGKIGGIKNVITFESATSREQGR